MNKFKVAYATGSRADYGIVREYLKRLNNDDEIELKILVTGSLLDEKYGYQVSLIEDDGFDIGAKIDVKINNESDAGIIKTMADTMISFSELFENKYRPDLLIVLGDRYEMFSVCVCAAMQRIPILHLHGGEATYANYDEFLRHSMSKMSLYHFTSAEEYKNRVIQLGEDPKRVFYLGALGAWNCLNIDEASVINDVKELSDKDYVVVLFHPETLTDIDVVEQTKIVTRSIKVFLDENRYAVFLGSNADTSSNKIRNVINEFVNDNNNAFYFENLNTASYHYLVKHAVCLIGNSSSGIIEAPSLNAYTINIGNRQAGRIRGNSVIDVKCDINEITDALHSVYKKYKNNEHENIINPYLVKNCDKEYYNKTKEILNNLKNDTKQPKEFYTINGDFD